MRLFLLTQIFYQIAFLCVANAATSCLDLFSQTRHTVKPVDWISGDLPEGFNAYTYTTVHRRFFMRGKFNLLTDENLTKLTTELEQTIAKPSSVEEHSVLQLELATLFLQYRPTHKSAKQSLEILAKAKDGLPKSPFFDQWVVEVQQLGNEIISEPPEKSRPIRQINWAISNSCPMCCIGCYFNFRQKTMNRDQIKLVSTQLSRSGVREVILTGGDPLRSDDLLFVVENLYSLGIKVAIDTTGYDLTPEIAKALKGKVAYIGIPLNGNNSRTIKGFRKGPKDTFERIIDAIKLCQENGIPVKINTTVSTANIESLVELASLISSLNLGRINWGWSLFQWWETRADQKQINLMKVDAASFIKAVREISTLFPELKIRVGSIDNRSRSYFEIMTDGSVYNYSSGTFPGTILIGNVLSQSVSELVNNPSLRADSGKFREWFSQETAGELK